MRGAFEGIDGLYFVWNSDWSIGGVLKAAADFVRGVESCSLCEIAYSGVREKSEWKECKAAIPVPLVVLFRNRLDDRLAAVAGDAFPVVLAEVGQRIVIAMDAASIEACRGDVATFKAALEQSCARLPR